MNGTVEINNKFLLFFNEIDSLLLALLGRIIPYDYNKYGDSPNCLPIDDGDEFVGEVSFVQGRGRTENGKPPITFLTMCTC